MRPGLSMIQGQVSILTVFPSLVYSLLEEGNKLWSRRLTLFVEHIGKGSVKRLIGGRRWKFEFLNLLNNTLSKTLIVHSGIYDLRRYDLSFRRYVPVDRNSPHGDRLRSFKMLKIAGLNFRVVFANCVFDLILFVRCFHLYFFESEETLTGTKLG